MKILTLILFMIFTMALLSLVLAVDIIDNTNTDFGQGTFFKTIIQGNGVATNITLNYTTIGISGCSECGTLSAGQFNYSIIGNFTSEINNTGNRRTIFDKITWTINLPNSSDVVGAVHLRVAGDAVVFLRNGQYMPDNFVNPLPDGLSFTNIIQTYTLPANFNYSDIIGFAATSSGSGVGGNSIIATFFRNGSYAGGRQQNLGSTLNFIDILSSFTLPTGFNTTDIVGFDYHNDSKDIAAFFKNGSYVADITQVDLDIPISLDTVRNYSIPSGFNYGNIIGVMVDGFSDTNDICAIFKNNSMVCDLTQTDLNSDIVFDTYYGVTYPAPPPNSGNIQTNITLQTRVSNDSITFTDWIEHSNEADGVGSFFQGNDTLNYKAQYIQYRAVFSTPDKYITPILENVTINYTTDLSPDTTNPSANITNKNFSDSLKFNKVLNITIFAQDEDIGLISGNITFNLTKNDLYNFSFLLSGTSAFFSQNITINLTRGNVINATAWVYDGTNYGQNSTLITVASNIIPNVSNISITPTPLAMGDNVKGHVLYNDTDNDIAGGNQTYWYINKTIINEANNSFTLLGGNVTLDANITFSARFNDTFEWGLWVNSSTLIVGDTNAPSFTNVSINNDTSYTSTETINITAVVTDASVLNFVRCTTNRTAEHINRTLTNIGGNLWAFASTLAVADYNIPYCYAQDTSLNIQQENTNIKFSVTTVPSGGSSPSGGGGGSSAQTVITITNKTNATQANCNFNSICEAVNGEDPFACPTDCKINTNYLFCDDPTQKCIKDLFDPKNKTVRFAVFATLIAGMVLILPKGSGLGKIFKGIKKRKQ